MNLHDGGPPARVQGRGFGVGRPKRREYAYQERNLLGNVAKNVAEYRAVIETQRVCRCADAALFGGPNKLLLVESRVPGPNSVEGAASVYQLCTEREKRPPTCGDFPTSSHPRKRLVATTITL